MTVAPKRAILVRFVEAEITTEGRPPGPKRVASAAIGLAAASAGAPGVGTCSHNATGLSAREGRELDQLDAGFA